MPKQRLTDGGIGLLKASPSRDTFYWDNKLPGFGVRVTSKGVRSYVVQFRPKDGSGERRLTLGRHGVLTLDQARQRARVELGRVAGGQNPVEERAAARRDATRAVHVDTLGRDYFADADAIRKPSTLKEYRRLWNRAVLPALGASPVRDVTRDDVTRLHRSMRRTPVSGNRALALLGSFFSYAVQQGTIGAHEKPTLGIKPYRETQKGRTLSSDEADRLLATLDLAEREGLPSATKLRAPAPTDPRRAKHRPKNVVHPASSFAVNAVRLLYLTGWRPGEVQALRWDSIDFERGRLTLRDSKTGHQLRPIGASVIEFLSLLPRVQGSPYVFPGSEPGRHIGNLKRFWENLREAADLAGLRLYDLRHNAITHGVDKHGVAVMQQVVGHKSIQTTLRYTHLGGDPIKHAADVIAGDLAARMNRRETPVTPLHRAVIKK